MDAVRQYTVVFKPENRRAVVPAGIDLLRAAAMAGIELRSGCGGEGTCGRCVVKILEGQPQVGQGNVAPKYRQEGYVNACRTLVTDDLVVEVPPTARLATHQVLVDRLERKEVIAEVEFDPLTRYARQPMGKRVTVKLDPPTITESTSDWARLAAKLKYERLNISWPALRTLPEVVRAADFEVTAVIYEPYDGSTPEVIAVLPGKPTKPLYGLAVDIGTTSNVVHLVDMETGVVVDKRGTYNRQARYGDDVITRIVHATEEKNGLAQLQQAIRETINEQIASLLAANGIAKDDIYFMVNAGNTTMAHLFLGIVPKYIRLEPYIPAASLFPVVRAADLGLDLHPAAPVLTYPAVASYVGGDIVSGLLATDISVSEEIALFADFGTNGEMVLGNKDWLVTCACSMGPAFEGGGILFGMRAVPGAIQRIEIDKGTYEVKVDTIGGEKAKGIAGSGLVDALAKLRDAGIIDRAGNFQSVDSPRRRDNPTEGPEFVLVWAAEADGGRDIVITESDVKNIIRAKGAAFSAMRTMLNSMSLDLSMVDKVYIAGGFGNYLNLADAIRIGLLPDVPREKYRFIGNSSIKGARAALLSRQAYLEAERLARQMTYLELSVDPSYMDEFVSALFIPHTDLSLFPSLPE